jgi:hypothetical protein
VVTAGGVVECSHTFEVVLVTAAGVLSDQVPQPAFVVEVATGVFLVVDDTHTLHDSVEVATGALEVEGSQTDQVSVSVLVEALGVFELDQAAQLVGCGCGTQIAEPVTTVVTTLQTGWAGAAWATAMAAAKTVAEYFISAERNQKTILNE